MSNLLYYGDNLDILHRCLTEETVDLVHLDYSYSMRGLIECLLPQPT
jgi:hypothetical protein